jgi:hypothetical protein
MTRRNLTLATYDDAIAEIERLARDGYRMTGKWTLGQMCRHLTWYAKGSLDGFGLKLPWLVRATLGRSLRKKILSGQPMREGMMTVPASVPPPGTDDSAAVAEYVALLRRLRDHDDPLHPSPLLGELTPEEWRRLHLNHTAHHLAFLVPN